MPHKHTRNGKWTGKWFGQVRHQGAKSRSPLYSTKAEATAWEVHFREALRNPETEPEPEPETVTICLIDWANKYLDYAARYRPNTYSEKRNIFRRLFKAVEPNTPVDALKIGAVLEYLQAQGKAGFSPNKARKNLGAAWGWGKKYMEGFPSMNPWLLVEEFPEERRPRYVPTERDFKRVLDLAEGRDWVMLLTFAHTAGRRSEVFNLRWDDVDFERKLIRLWTRKRHGGRLEYDWLPLTNDLCEALLDLQTRATCEWVFPQLWGRSEGKPFLERRGFPQELCHAAEVRPFGLHAIRHLTASLLASSNVPMVQIQAILRHRKLSTTEGYVRGLEPVRPALRVLEGRLLKRSAQDKAQQKAQQGEKKKGSSAANA